MTSDSNSTFRSKAEERFSLVGTILMWILIIAVFCAIPLYLRNKYEYIAAGKFRLFLEIGRWTAIVMGLFASGYYAGRGLSKNELKAFKSILPVDLFVFAYTVENLICYALSPYKFMGDAALDAHSEGAFWGCAGWFMGILTYMIMVLFYLVVSRFFIYTNKFLIPVLLAAEIVFFWGILNRFRVSIFGFDGQNPKFIASIGNINWFCGYSSIIVPLMMGLYWYRGQKNRLLYGAILFTGFMTVIINGSDSGIMAIFVTLVFLLVYSLKEEDTLRACSEVFLVFSAADMLIAVLNLLFKHFLSFEGMLTMLLIDIRVALLVALVSWGLFYYLWQLRRKGKVYPSFMKYKAGKIVTALTIGFFVLVIALIVINTMTGGRVPIIGGHSFFTFNREWGTLRGTNWEAAIILFLEQPTKYKFFGSGQDTFWFLLSDYDEVRNMVVRYYHTIRLTNAHCEWLNILDNQGILGVITYAGMFVSLFAVLYKRVKEHPEFMMFLLVIIMYHVNNLISFEQVISTPVYYMTMGIGASAVVWSEMPRRG